MRWYALNILCGHQNDNTMKSPTATTNDCDDIFGPPRTYATGYCPPKTRPTMISAKYRQKEERRKVLKISINKLKKIEDPEASLCRSVLINNTMKRLQKEAKDEKVQKQQLNYPRCYDQDNYMNIKNEFLKSELKASMDFEENPSDAKLMDSLKVDFAIESDFDAKLADEISVLGSAAESCKGMDVVLNGLVDESFGSLEGFAESAKSSRKRSFDDMEDCDVQDVLSQFYMPPTPRMLTCIDDDEDVNVVDDEPMPKRCKSDNSAEKVEQFGMDVDTDKLQSSVCNKSEDEYNTRVTAYINNNLPETESRLRYNTQTMETENAFSCGHASMFNELQSNVFHSLIASLET